MKAINNVIKEKILSKGKSLSRDYYIFAGFIIIAALTSSIWLALKMHQEQKASMENQLKTQTQIIASELNNYFEYVSHIAEDKGHKIALKGEKDLQHIAHIFKRNFFFPITKAGLKEKAFRWPHFSWIDINGDILVESESGILKKRKKAKNSQHLYQSMVENWILHLSNPVYDPVEGEFFINASLGISSINKEKYIGTIFTRFEVDKLVQTIKKDLKPNIDFIILNENLQIIIKSDLSPIKNPNFFINKLKNIKKDLELIPTPLIYEGNIYKISKIFPKYSLTILTGYNPNISNKEFLIALLKRGAEIFGAVFFILAILYFQHLRIINPINHLAQIVRKIAKGEEVADIREQARKVKRAKKYPYEIHKLRESVLITKILMDRERKRRKLAETNKAELIDLNMNLEQENEIANKSKISRDRFVSEMRCRIVESSVTKMVDDIASLMNHQKGEFIITQSAIEGLHKKMLERCSKILSYISDELIFSDTSVKRIIEEAINMQEYDAYLNDVKLITDVKNNLPDIYVDEKAVKHIVTSLIFYAMEDRKRNRSGAFVKLSAMVKKQKQGKNLVITIKDNGFGISEEMRMEFEQDNERNGGVGNSVAISIHAVRHLLELHQGSLNIENNPGQGSLIIITLPYLKKPEEKNELSSKPKKIKEKGNLVELFPST